MPLETEFRSKAADDEEFERSVRVVIDEPTPEVIAEAMERLWTHVDPEEE